MKWHNRRLKSTEGVHASVPITCHSHRLQLTKRDVYVSYFSLVNKDINQGHIDWFQPPISDRFEFWSYLTSHFGVTCPSAVKKMMSPDFLSHL